MDISQIFFKIINFLIKDIVMHLKLDASDKMIEKFA